MCTLANTSSCSPALRLLSPIPVCYNLAIKHLYVYVLLGGIVLLIHRMTATFGKLQNKTLELKDGLNILEAPNETGKSTWCAFLLAMLYGINSRERDKAGSLAEKNRYAPWSGAVMSGRIDCKAAGAELTLLRSTRRQNAPMGEFQALYTGTGEPFPGLTGAECGETLLGVSREVYERSAFIRQVGIAITQDAGLERRIAALITSGEEDTSYMEAAELLKKQLNRRRHNKTGQLPALEEELRTLQEQLSAQDALTRQLTAAQEQAQQLASREETLREELTQYDRWTAAQERRALEQARQDSAQADQRAQALRSQLEADHIPENETIGRLRGAIVNLETTRKAVAKTRAARDDAAKALLRAEAAVSESPFAGQSVENAQKAVGAVPAIRPVPWWLAVVVGILAGAAAWFSRLFAVVGVGGIGIAAALVCAVLLALRRRKDRAAYAAYLKARGAQSEEELRALADAYAALVQARDEAQAEADKRSAAADALYNTLSSNEQAILLEIRRFAPAAFDAATADNLLRQCAIRRQELTRAENAAKEARMRLELLQKDAAADDGEEAAVPPSRSREAICEELSAAQAELTAARSAADRLAGQLHAAGDAVATRSEEGRLTSEIADLEEEYRSIRLAMDALERANSTLQSRFSPALGRRAAEIFHQLSGGRYSGVVLDRAFHLSAEPAGQSEYRPAAYLSAGAVDQLYLAVRLAICELVLPAADPAPLVLDDALATFDDARCAATLQWLKEEAKKRQILLFTCHGREAELLSGDPAVHVQRLSLSTL